MVNHFVANVAKALELNIEHVETYWKNAQIIALTKGKDSNAPDFYAYVTGIFKRMLIDNESVKVDAQGKLILPRAESIMNRLNIQQQRILNELAPIVAQEETPPVKSASLAPLPDDDSTEAQTVLARDLAELYKEMLIRWETISDEASANLDITDNTQFTWHPENPYGTLPAVVREVLQAGAALHFSSLSDVRDIAKKAMMSWQATQPTLLDDMKALTTLPTIHRRALLPLIKALVKQGNLPESVIELVKKSLDKNANNWLNVFPSLLASNAAQSPHFSEHICNAVTDTLIECLLN
ncbi:hypothetical protein [Pseudoalteromonas umbrosa]|uniref:hypothetical protein n=1 Tax=Pseudoalteromonas umbrosa TaxID=3048489 RepID=UPI0024C2BA5C|nr:hypothetical protein [Pseudoalteromonas sp. B95]MDK1290243.1 hypothetical protein [Pseudoalteromonas sp. B95]